ncbi:hypothetical protein [Corynebacterium macginleyi]
MKVSQHWLQECSSSRERLAQRFFGNVEDTVFNIAEINAILQEKNSRTGVPKPMGISTWAKGVVPTWRILTTES